jgi:hypothetical protein
MFFFTVNATEDRHESNSDRTDADDHFPPIMIVALYLPIVFLTVAIMINLRNWIYYYLKIGEMAYHNQFQGWSDPVDSDSHLQRLYLGVNRSILVINVVMVCCIIGTAVAMTWICLYAIFVCEDCLELALLITGL